MNNRKNHVSVACVHCKKAHLACDNQRPCRRCVCSGKADTCVDLKHKKRGRPPLVKKNHIHTDSSDVPSLTGGSSVGGDTESESSSSVSISKLLDGPYSPTNLSETSSAQSSDDYCGQNKWGKSINDYVNNGSFANKRVKLQEHTMDCLSEFTNSFYNMSVPSRNVNLPSLGLGGVGGGQPEVKGYPDLPLKSSATIVCDLEKLSIVQIDEKDSTIGITHTDLMLLTCSLYDLIHDVDRHSLFAFHSKIMESVRTNKFDSKISAQFHLRSKFNVFKLVQVTWAPHAVSINTKPVINLTLVEYEHPRLFNAKLGDSLVRAAHAINLINCISPYSQNENNLY